MTDLLHETHLDQLLPAYVNGTLDAPAAERVRAHLLACARCRAERDDWLAIGAAAQLDAARTPAPSRDLLARVRARIDQAPTTDAPPARRPGRALTALGGRAQRLAGPLGGLAAAALLLAAVFLTPLGSYAQDFLTIFTPRQFVAVPVSAADLRALPDLRDYGTMTEPSRGRPTTVASAAEAASLAGFAVRAPATLPAGVQPGPQYQVLPGETATFTFSAARAEATARARGQTLPPMPASIDGSSIRVTTGPAVLAVYRSAAAGSTKPTPRGTDEPLPALVIAQTTAPAVESTGVSVAELRDYLLAQPGISPALARAIRAIGDPSTVLPIPVPVDQAVSHPVQVQGASGLAVADSTGVGGGVIWQQDGFIFGVGGTLSESDLLAVANSLR